MASFISLILGLVVYAAGFLMYSYAWHHYNYWGLGEDRSGSFRMMEWGQWAEGSGTILVFLGVAFMALGIVRWNRKKVQDENGETGRV